MACIFTFCSPFLHAENKEWNIYKNFDYWKYPTIAITRNTSIEGHRIRTEITCFGSYLNIKLIYSFPNDSMPTPAQAIVMELDGKKYNFYGNGVFKEQDPVFYSVYSMRWMDRTRDEIEADLFYRSFYEKLLHSDNNLTFILTGSTLNINDYKNLTFHDVYWWEYKEWPLENAEILDKSKTFSTSVTLKNYKESHDELLTYCHHPFDTYTYGD